MFLKKSWSKNLQNFSIIFFLIWFIQSLPYFQDHQQSLVFKIIVVVCSFLIGLAFILNSDINEKVQFNHGFESGTTTSVVFVMIFFFATGVYLFNLGHINFYDDEFITISVAKGHLQTGEYLKWNFFNNESTGIEYNRAWPYTWLVSKTIGVLGISEFSVRLVSAIAGAGFIMMIAIIAQRLFGSIVITLTICAVMLLQIELLYYFRQGRMYGVLILMYSCLSILYFVIFEKVRNQEFKKLDWIFCILLAVLVIATILVHKNALILIVPLTLYPIFSTHKWVISTWRNYKLIIIPFAVVGVFYLIRFLIYYKFFEVFKLSDDPSYSYATYIFTGALNWEFNMVLFLLGLILIFRMKECLLRRVMLFAYVTIIPSLILFVFLFQFPHESFRYVSHLVPVSIILIFCILIVVLNSINNSRVKNVGLCVLLILSCSKFLQANNLRHLYYGSVHPKFEVAYRTFLDNVEIDDTIFAAYMRSYYLQDFSSDIDVIDIVDSKVKTDEYSKSYTFDEFFKDINTVKKGWVIWPTAKSGNVNRKVKIYTNRFFHKIHGLDVDDTYVEVFRFDSTMVKKVNWIED
ncbi:MAG: glycosyltransferase family 39 protein [Cyclobacteriaceae bacterium]